MIVEDPPPNNYQNSTVAGKPSFGERKKKSEVIGVGDERKEIGRNTFPHFCFNLCTYRQSIDLLSLLSPI